MLYAELCLLLREDRREQVQTPSDLVNMSYLEVAPGHMCKLRKRLEALAWQARKQKDKLLRVAGELQSCLLAELFVQYAFMMSYQFQSDCTCVNYDK